MMSKQVTIMYLSCLPIGRVKVMILWKFSKYFDFRSFCELPSLNFEPIKFPNNLISDFNKLTKFESTCLTNYLSIQ